MEVKYKGAGIAPMMRAFGDRGKDGVITLEEFEDESGGGFSTVQFAHARLKKCALLRGDALSFCHGFLGPYLIFQSFTRSMLARPTERARMSAAYCVYPFDIFTFTNRTRHVVRRPTPYMYTDHAMLCLLDVRRNRRTVALDIWRNSLPGPPNRTRVLSRVW